MRLAVSSPGFLSDHGDILPGIALVQRHECVACDPAPGPDVRGKGRIVSRDRDQLAHLGLEEFLAQLRDGHGTFHSFAMEFHNNNSRDSVPQNVALNVAFLLSQNKADKYRLNYLNIQTA